MCNGTLGMDSSGGFRMKRIGKKQTYGNRICCRSVCQKTFSCKLECGDKFCLAKENYCYCPECAKDRQVTHKCRSRFG